MISKVIFLNMLVTMAYGFSLPVLRPRKALLSSLSLSSSLSGFQNFVRSNPLTDKFGVKSFHHIEFYCGDATNSYKRFMAGKNILSILLSSLKTSTL
jgi:hypothetical protein